MIVYALRHKPSGLFRAYRRPRPDNTGRNPDFYFIHPPLQWGVNAKMGSTPDEWEVVRFRVEEVKE